MSTEPGESSTATGNGDLLVSRIFGDSKQQFSMGGLINVPDHLRKLDEQAFTPLLISIGPIHHSNVKLQTMKQCKVQFCKCFIQRAKMDFELLEQTIRGKEDGIRSFYAETIVSSISSDDFVTMIVVDGMFILEYFLRQSNPRLVEKDHMIAEWMPPILKYDLVLLENQLPFFVLEMLFEQAIELEKKPLRELAFEFFKCYNFQMMAFEKFNAKIEHLTDLVRLFHLGECERLPDRILGGAKLSYSAIQLHEAGVKFKGVKFEEATKRYGGNRGFLDIRYDLKNGVLEIPCIKLNDEKIEQAIELEKKPLRELAFEFFKCYNFQMMAFEKFNAKIEHLTDLVRLFHLGECERLPDRILGGAKLSYSAIQLHEAGVKFKGVKFEEATKRYGGNRGFLDIRYDLKNGVLEIPCIKLNDEKIRVIRNIIALEQSHYVGHTYVTDYFVILDFLINTSKDVDLLCDKGILINYLGDSNVAASAVNRLNTNILWDYMNPRYSKICEDLNAFYKKPWHRWRATLWRQYFSTPWRVASTSAAILFLVLTAIQTACSLKSTKW